MKSTLFLLAMLIAYPVVAGVYKWTDAHGRIHYSDAPPQAAKTMQLRLQTYSGPPQVGRVAGSESGVTLYTTEWCGVCKRAKGFMQQNGVPFREWDVEKTEYGAAKFRQLGGTGVPLITVGTEKMMGFDAAGFMEIWKRSKQ